MTYRENLRDIILRNIGSNALLYTTDGISDKFLRCGVVSGAYATIDFGTSTNVTNNFELMRKYQPSVFIFTIFNIIYKPIHLYVLFIYLFLIYIFINRDLLSIRNFILVG